MRGCVRLTANWASGLKFKRSTSAPIKSPSLANRPGIFDRMASVPSGRPSVGRTESMPVMRQARGARSTISALCQQRFRNSLHGSRRMAGIKFARRAVIASTITRPRPVLSRLQASRALKYHPAR